MSMPFKWQINASSVGKLVGAFWLKNESPDRASVYQREELAKTWRLNLKRMPRFGVRPATTIARELVKRRKTETSEETAHKAMLNSTSIQVHVRQAIGNQVDQRRAINAIEEDAAKAARAAQENAELRAAKASKAAQTAIDEEQKANRLCIMSFYKTVKSGVSRTRANGWFAIRRNAKLSIYKMSATGRSASLSTIAEAKSAGWIIPEEMQSLRKHVEKSREDANKSKAAAVSAAAKASEQIQVAKHIRKVATQHIQTTRGSNAENNDLKRVQKKAPSVREGNRKAYFFSIQSRPYNAFVIGYIDGFDSKTQTVIELKHRARGLFGELREYERVQCFMYMKMLRVKKARLIETYKDEQRAYDIVWDDTTWRRIEHSLVQVARDLNRAEKDDAFRKTLIETIIQ